MHINNKEMKVMKVMMRSKNLIHKVEMPSTFFLVDVVAIIVHKVSSKKDKSHHLPYGAYLDSYLQ